ncbi:olfactory receptor 52E2-like [Dendropsophus ebraccatus]|uniref:olfactory receptor 52E2-like n=1 Tax=Dendropsophus ebraccatus TaxID=150705 RepID=UPI003832242B
MLLMNYSHPFVFILLGIPGLEDVECWISIPFCCMYIIAFFGNIIILLIIRYEKRLHEPMFFFLSMLSMTDVVLSSSTLPKMLGIFWFNLREIRFEACLTQMFFIHSFTAIESGFFLAMAFDRYVAICNPLRHSAILSRRTVLVIGISVVFRALVFFLPHPLIIRSLIFCETNIIPHTYCEFMAVIKLACEDSSVQFYSLIIAAFMGVFDLLWIIISYTLILYAVLNLPTKQAGLKALSTCTSHIIVILIFYSTATFTFATHRFGHNIQPQIHISIANIYLLVPPMLNPVIYGVRTKRIRETIVQIICAALEKQIHRWSHRIRAWRVCLDQAATLGKRIHRWSHRMRAWRAFLDQAATLGKRIHRWSHRMRAWRAFLDQAATLGKRIHRWSHRIRAWRVCLDQAATLGKQIHCWSHRMRAWRAFLDQAATLEKRGPAPSSQCALCDQTPWIWNAQAIPESLEWSQE